MPKIKFLRLTIFFLAALAAALAGLALAIPYLFPTTPVFGPPPPVITPRAPRGALPAGQAGLTEWARDAGGEYVRVGSGLLLRLPDGTVIGVTTAHSVGGLGRPGQNLQRLALSLPDGSGRIEFDTLYGPPGQPRTMLTLTGDYLLLRLPGPAPDGLALTPDPRGAPEVGERVRLSSGLGDGQGGPRWLSGTVQTVDDQALWVVLDEPVDAGGMSGSPLFSQHTGQLLGMAIAVYANAGRTYLGFHPVWHLVQLALAAREFPPIADYQPAPK